MGIAALMASIQLAIAPAPVSVHERLLLGHSALGRPIVATHTGNPRSAVRILVVGCIHGTEDAAIPVARRLAASRPPRHANLWVVPNLNPDGRALGVRLNGRGVDLNRNFSAGWVPLGRRWDPQYSGPRPFSEAETRIARALVERVRPTITIWFHQPTAYVRAWGGSVPDARRFARLAGVPFRRMPWLAGTAPNWQNHRFPGTSSFVVELPPGRLSKPAVARFVHATLTLARSAPKQPLELAGPQSRS